jgi:hypothetical protein
MLGQDASGGVWTSLLATWCVEPGEFHERHGHVGRGDVLDLLRAAQWHATVRTQLVWLRPANGPPREV